MILWKCPSCGSVVNMWSLAGDPYECDHLWKCKKCKRFFVIVEVPGL